MQILALFTLTLNATMHSVFPCPDLFPKSGKKALKAPTLSPKFSRLAKSSQKRNYSLAGWGPKG
jgi:hypothetical protein